MNQIVQLTLVIKDYDAAIEFYTEKLRFQLLEDTKLDETKRWVRVAPPYSQVALLLAKAKNEEQLASVGNQTGGRVFLFMHTDDFDGYYEFLVKKGVKIIREPSTEPYGKVCVFADLYGNLWDLIEPTRI
ncbi:Catechol 2,3-dioxygenase [Ekhidna lutea]|uniref:Catechol 2,3-dioxygenase n=1 Tax=Ekhidna lutea TaxID=447679 RepID=A0A239JFC5_EKHLU|nr:VOC family protein [Ekhidna lutea]SNT04302.1 Catechol 2,3-dioxygenase [Ekhidna lutea]